MKLVTRSVVIAVAIGAMLAGSGAAFNYGGDDMAANSVAVQASRNIVCDPTRTICGGDQTTEDSTCATPNSTHEGFDGGWILVSPAGSYIRVAVMALDNCMNSTSFVREESVSVGIDSQPLGPIVVYWARMTAGGESDCRMGYWHSMGPGGPPQGDLVGCPVGYPPNPGWGHLLP